MMAKKTVLSLVGFLFLGVGSLFAEGDWFTNVPEAQKVAKQQNKAVFIEFTGSDWCPPCMMMKKKVFSKKAFLEGAKKNFVLVKIDLPQGDEALSKKNSVVAEKYKVRGFPTIVLLDSEGKEFSRFIASRYRSVKAMLKHLDKQLEKK